MKHIRLIFLLIIAVVIIVQASPTQAEDNIAPTIESVYMSSSANAKTDAYPGGTINDLVPGGTRAIHINGVVEDLDGKADIDKVRTVFYRSSVTGGINCTKDKNDCYKINECTLSDNANPNQKEYDCQIDISFFADATDNGGSYPIDSWFVFVKVIDVATASDVDTSISKEIQAMLSLSFPAAINYGSFSLGQSTTDVTNQHYIVTQFGNDQADVQVKGSDMTCDPGSLPVGNQEWSITDVSYTSGTDLTESFVTTNINIGYRTDDATPLAKTLYWNMGIPAVGVGGTCVGTTVIEAITD